MNNAPPIQEPAGSRWSTAWANWFQQVFSCLPWRKGFSAVATLDFPSVAAHTEQSLTMTISGARIGDAATVCPSAHTPGIIYSAVITAADAATIYAQNYTAGAIDPASTNFRVIVFQN